MNPINKLKQEVVDIENQAGTLDPTDYEALYTLLAKAFFKCKDIIELTNDVNPIIPPPTSELQDLHEKYNLASTQLDLLNKEAAQHTVEIEGLNASLLRVQANADTYSKTLAQIHSLAE